MQRKIIICTLMSSMYLTLAGFGKIFSHIFIDEAAHGSEIDSVIPIGLFTFNFYVLIFYDF